MASDKHDKQTTIRLPAGMLSRLKEIAKEQDRSLPYLIRKAIEEKYFSVTKKEK